MTEIKYDTPIEVTKEQYLTAEVNLRGVAAFQEKDGKYFVKLWHGGYKPALRKILKLL